MNILFKHRLFFMFVLVAFVSCRNNNKKPDTENGIMPTSTLYNSNKLLDSLSTLFLDFANCKSCLNELYIDKVYEDEIYITFISREYYTDFLNNKKPLFYFLVKEKRIFVFTGAELFILGNQLNAKEFPIVIPNSVQNQYLRMAFHIIGNKVELVKIANHPFTPQLEQFR